jgi:2-polyprenyl-3-methyl-5-hydroxy-6-metoxy-1,4-benzoquinol methylase
MGTDRTWEQYGKTDPYFGVLSHDRYRRANMSEADLREFFASGEAHVEQTLASCERYLGADLPKAKAIDFGCGVGRLTLPLARRFASVVGVDVSASMIEEARARAGALQLENVGFCRSLEELSGLQGTFSFVNSYIVLQHVSPARGLKYVADMLSLLSSGGFGALHVVYGREKDAASRGVRSAASRAAHIVGQHCSDWLRQLRRREPKMQMNPYPLNQLMFLLQAAGADTVHGEFTDHGGHLGIVLIFAKARV